MRRASLLLLVAAGACGPAEPALKNPLRAPVELTDVNPAPDIVEVYLAAAPAEAEYLEGKRAAVWAFRDAAVEGSAGTVPGPMLRAKQGDTVIVHFQNELPEPTTVHWHGLRLPAPMDGSTSTQPKIDPGGTFEYRFTVRDAGSFWYHPHVSAEQQIEKGLYAPFVVEGGVVPDVSADRYFVLDDVKVDAAGQLAQGSDELDAMMGRQGNVLLVNGQRLPELAVKVGARERWRFVNSANGRYFNLSLPGHSFLVIGWDGGLLPEPYSAETLLVAPGERYEVLVTFAGSAGDRVALRTSYYDRGHNMPDPGPKDLLSLALTSPSRSTPAPLPEAWGSFTSLGATAATPSRSFVLRETETPNGVVFSINGESWPFNSPVVVRQGGLEIWEIQNEAEMDHPFHLHGMFFEVLSVGGAPALRQGWKDTVNVPMFSTVRFAVRYEPLGTWMFHCHILEHAEKGMMGDLMVEP